MKTRRIFHINFTSCFQNSGRSTAWAMLCLALCMLGLGVSTTAQGPTIITFDAPGAGTSAGQGTNAIAIIPMWAITGLYIDNNSVVHSFLRARDGTITTFEAPGAGSETVSGFLGTAIPGVLGGQGTYSVGINPAGAITGFYVDASNAVHGFLRAPDGTFTTFDAPSLYAGGGFGQGTYPGNINPAGWIAGNTVDGNDVAHGFVRAPDGTITEFDVPGAGNESGQGTQTGWASCINLYGAMTGEYIDEDNVVHGYIRAPDGTITEFDAPGAGAVAGSFQGTYAWSINPAGAAMGEYVDTNNVGHGFVRAGDGTITTFDVPGAGTGTGQGTIPLTNVLGGATTGTYIDGGGVIHGFLRLPGPPWIW